MEGAYATNAVEAVTNQGDGHDDRAVLEDLEPDQLVAAKRQPFGPRRLGSGTRVLMWGLRGYVLLMVVVVIDRVVQGMAGG